MKIYKGRRKRTSPKVRRTRQLTIGYRDSKYLAQQANIHSVLHNSGVQAKLTIGQPNDRYETEADHVADQVVSLPDSPVQRQVDGDKPEEELQTKPLSDQITPLVQRQESEPEEEEPVQTKWNQSSVQRQETGDEKEEPVQAKGVTTEAVIAPKLTSEIQSLRGKGRPMSLPERAYYEARFGSDFSQIRIHADSQSHRLARRINARAFTLGNDMVFASGEYQPHTESGKRLVAHELTHTIQQSRANRGTVKPKIQRTKANLYVYDSTQGGALGLAWRSGAWGLTKVTAGGYAVSSGRSILTMLRRMLSRFRSSGCSCIEEIQFWGHGSSGESMDLKAVSGQKLEASDFNIQGINRFRQRRNIFALLRKHGAQKAVQIIKARQAAYISWRNGLKGRPQAMVDLRENMCPSGAEVYYRSCETFQGKKGKAFARAAATFWRSKVIGHTHVIGLSQPGKQTLKPGQKPTWSDKAGTGGGKSKHWLKTLFKSKTLKKLFKYIPFI